MKEKDEIKELLKLLLELNFSERRIDYYMSECRKVGFYELEEERREFLKTLKEKIKKEHEKSKKIGCRLKKMRLYS